MTGALNEGCQNIFWIFKKALSSHVQNDFSILRFSAGLSRDCAWAWMSTGPSHACFICSQRRAFSLCNGAQSPSCLRCCSLGVTPPPAPPPSHPPLRFRLDLWLEGNVSPHSQAWRQLGTGLHHRPPRSYTVRLPAGSAMMKLKEVTNSAFITHAGICAGSWKSDPEMRPSRGRVRI